jgi:hypothetical protein
LLELLLTKVRTKGSQVQIIGMSATLPNINVRPLAILSSPVACLP